MNESAIPRHEINLRGNTKVQTTHARMGLRKKHVDRSAAMQKRHHAWARKHLTQGQSVADHNPHENTTR